MTAHTETASDGMDAATAGWLEMFFRFFAAPSPESYRPLFHPAGSLQDAGMAEPLPAAQTGSAIAAVLEKLPDLRIRPLRHAARGTHVFVEARNSGTLNGSALDWGAVYRVQLRDGLVYRGRRFYDQVDLFRPILPEGATLPAFPGAPEEEPEEEPDDEPEAAASTGDLLARLAAAWNDASGHGLASLYGKRGSHAGPGVAAPLPRDRLAPYRRWLDALLAPGEMQVADWAADGSLLFVEWRCTGRFMGAAVPLDRIDRYLLDTGGRIAESRSYMDTLALVERAMPEVAAIRAAVIKG